MRLLKQLELIFEGGTRSPSAFFKSSSERPIHLRKRDYALESQACALLRQLGAEELARKTRVEWNPRLKTCAGRADYRDKLISLNPLLREYEARSIDPQSATSDLECKLHSSPTQHRANRGVPGKLECKMHSSFMNPPQIPGGVANVECNLHSRLVSPRKVENNGRQEVILDEIERTLRHELAHLLAQWRVGRRRIAPHGAEWREACRDLGIADEARCHNLPFASKTFPPRYVYRCPNCKVEFPRVRRIRRAIACLACCRKFNGGDFDDRFRLKQIK